MSEKKVIQLIALAILIMGAVVVTAGEDDHAAIEATVRDYVDGWYAGDAARMERALHPDLAKRIVRSREGQSQLQHMTAEQLVEATRSGYGRQTPEDQRQMDVTILDIYRGAAVVKIVAREWIDYLQVAKYNDRWVIVNVLWELKPRDS